MTPGGWEQALSLAWALEAAASFSREQVGGVVGGRETVSRPTVESFVHVWGAASDTVLVPVPESVALPEVAFIVMPPPPSVSVWPFSASV